MFGYVPAHEPPISLLRGKHAHPFAIRESRIRYATLVTLRYIVTCRAEEGVC
jgi:hypothetical protein